MTALVRTTALCGAFAALYVVLYHFSSLISASQGFQGVASALFLPAFVRLLGFLLIGYWIIPALFLGGAFLSLTGSYDLAPGVTVELVMTAFTAVGGPFGVFVASRVGRLQPSLENLTALRLMGLSIGCAAGNAVFHRMAIEVVGITPGNVQQDFVIFFGDFVGTWVIIYLIKTVLTLYGYARRT